MSGDEFISLAGTLAAAATTDEARYRTAVSRAYYGAFHLAASLLGEFHARLPRNHAAHNEIYRLLSIAPHPEPRSAARFLNDLRGERNSADYDLSDSRFRAQENVKLCVEYAHRVRKSLEACRQEPARSALLQVLQPNPGRGAE